MIRPADLLAAEEIAVACAVRRACRPPVAGGGTSISAHKKAPPLP